MRAVPHRLRPLVAVALGAAVAACEPAAAPPPPKAAAPPPPRALLAGLEGQVQVKRADAVGWEDAAAGLELAAEDKVRTMKGASARLEFQGGSTVLLDEESLVSVAASAGAAAVRLLEGRVDADVIAGAPSVAVEAAGGTIRAARREVSFQ